MARYYAEVRVFEHGEDFVNEVVNGDTLDDAIDAAVYVARKLGGKIKINGFDTEHVNGTWCIYSETKNTWRK